MAKFLSTTALNSELEKLIREAQKELLFVSPYIKLHSNIRSILETKKERPEVSITVVFGKNKDNPSQSLGKEDMEFFQAFPSIEIRYSERLHAKYYASENGAILTSMNLYDFSQNNNIEFGVLLKTNFFKDIAVALTSDGSLDLQAYEYFHQEVIPQAKLLFKREPQYDKGIAGTGINKKYRESIVTTNSLLQKPGTASSEVNQTRNLQITPKYLAPFTTAPQGYCIRTGALIPFNTKRPLSEDAFKNWSKFSNPDYAEKFCHFSGEPSNGETTFAKPILRKNWKKAQEIHEGKA